MPNDKLGAPHYVHYGKVFHATGVRFLGANIGHFAYCYSQIIQNPLEMYEKTASLYRFHSVMAVSQLKPIFLRTLIFVSEKKFLF